MFARGRAMLGVCTLIHLGAVRMSAPSPARLVRPLISTKVRKCSSLYSRYKWNMRFFP